MFTKAGCSGNTRSVGLSWSQAAVTSVAIVSAAAVVSGLISELFATGRAGMAANSRRGLEAAAAENAPTPVP